MDFVSGPEDFSTSPSKALSEIDKDWKKLPGLIVFGSHAQHDVGEKLEMLREAREKKIPTLGICFGLHLQAVEWARNVLNLPDANSTEIKRMCADPVVVKLPELRVGIHKAEGRYESFWHNYRVNPVYYPQFYKEWNLSTTGDMLDSMTLKGHPHYTGVQYHPEYGSSKDKPHPVLKRFLDVCRNAV